MKETSTKQQLLSPHYYDIRSISKASYIASILKAKKTIDDEKFQRLQNFFTAPPTVRYMHAPAFQLFLDTLLLITLLTIYAISFVLLFKNNDEFDIPALPYVLYLSLISLKSISGIVWFKYVAQGNFEEFSNQLFKFRLCFDVIIVLAATYFMLTE